ncbi:MAG: putative molybdenum carrier protein [Pseudomonadota bacterium]
MLKKIISGGQTGADRAALDVAIKFNIEHGGWIPKGRKAEDGPLSDQYKLIEMETDDYRERTRQNIIDSHGTVIVSRAELTGGSKLTQSYARVVGRPNCFINLSYTEEFEASEILKSFILENQIQVLNVAGPRLSSQPWIYQDVKVILEVTLFLLFSDSEDEQKVISHVPVGPFDASFPETLADAATLICDDLPLKTRVYIANLAQHRIRALYFSFQDYIKQRVGFNSENTPLLASCFENHNPGHFGNIEDAVMLIIKAIKKQLETDHILRVIQ